MGPIFWVFSHLAVVISILVLALALSAGLYLVAELTEEFPTTTGKVLRYSLIVIAILQVLLFFDGLPLLPSLLQLLAYAAYASTLQNFPFVQLVFVPVIACVVLFLVTNAMWLYSFLGEEYDAFSVIGYFVILVWSVPIGLFVSLTANDLVLPGVIGQPKAENGLRNDYNSLNNSSSSNSNGKKRSIFKVIFESLSESTNIFPGVGQLFSALKAVQDKRR